MDRSEEILQKVNPGIWEDERTGQAKIVTPIQVRLCPKAKIPNLK